MPAQSEPCTFTAWQCALIASSYAVLPWEVLAGFGRPLELSRQLLLNTMTNHSKRSRREFAAPSQRVFPVCTHQYEPVVSSGGAAANGDPALKRCIKCGKTEAA